MKYTISEYNASQRKQYINMQMIYDMYIAKKQEYYLDYNVSMYFSKIGNKEYLTKKRSFNNTVIYLGEKSQATETILTNFVKHKSQLKDELKRLSESVDKNSKLNKIEKLTRVPNIIVDIYAKINEFGLDDKILLIGTNSLYAYEAHCGVFLQDEHLATFDVDLFNKRDKKVSFVYKKTFENNSFEHFIKQIDKTFIQNIKVPYQFTNEHGDIVEFITISDDKKTNFENFGEVIPLEIDGMQWLENARTFKAAIVALNGKSSNITTIHPLEFAVYKHWLSKKEDRNLMKAQRDEEQSKIVTELIQDYMVNIDIEKELKSIKSFKKEIVDMYWNDIVINDAMSDIKSIQTSKTRKNR